MSKKLHVRAVPENGFWRLGRFWPHQGVEVAASEFSEDDLARLKSEKLLTVEPVETTEKKNGGKERK